MPLAPFPFTEVELEASLPARLARVTARFGARPAIVDARQSLTYAELEAAANQVAHRILASASAGAPVALLLPHDATVIVALLGALKAGHPYCALNPLFPDERNRLILEDLQCRLILTDADRATDIEPPEAVDAPLFAEGDVDRVPGDTAHADRLLVREASAQQCGRCALEVRRAGARAVRLRLGLGRHADAPATRPAACTD